MQHFSLNPFNYCLMKRIEFIAPVEAVRGNLSGRQDLRYAENNNKAYESPAGSVNYARNYTPRYVGAKIAATGAKIFSVRTKNAVNMTPKAIKAMALLGGTGAIVGSLLAHKSGTPYQQVHALWQYAIATTPSYAGYSFRKFASEFIRPQLKAKAENITANIASITVSFKNPWFDGSQTTGATISQKVLVEFWGQLAPNAVVFTVNGRKGIGKTSTTFGDIVASSALNVLGLTIQEQSETNYILCDSEYVKDDNGNYVIAEVHPVNGAKYTTTSVQPE